MTTIPDVLHFPIGIEPDRTEIESVRAAFGRDGYRQHVNGDGDFSLSGGEVERRGKGSPPDVSRHRRESIEIDRRSDLPLRRDARSFANLRIFEAIADGHTRGRLTTLDRNA